MKAPVSVPQKLFCSAHWLKIRDLASNQSPKAQSPKSTQVQSSKFKVHKVQGRKFRDPQSAIQYRGWKRWVVDDIKSFQTIMNNCRRVVSRFKRQYGDCLRRDARPAHFTLTRFRRLNTYVEENNSDTSDVRRADRTTLMSRIAFRHWDADLILRFGRRAN